MILQLTIGYRAGCPGILHIASKYAPGIAGLAATVSFPDGYLPMVRKSDIIDFGVAKAMQQQLTERTLFTGFGTVIGAFEYMSHAEQAALNALDVDKRSDVYSPGVLLYEQLTGAPPSDRDRLCKAAFSDVLLLIREEEPPRSAQD